MRAAAIGLILVALKFVLAAQACAQPTETTPPSKEIEILQKRLTDAGCYHGPLDGKSSADLEHAKNGCPDQNPQLRIETGMHVDVIRSIAVDANCSLAVTGSEDKTIRIWSLPDGQLRRTVRPPIGAGELGAVYGVALSPDRRWIAVGGWTNQQDDDHVTLYAVDGGESRHLGPLSGVAYSVAFTPDGQRLAVGLAIGGLRIFNVATGQQIFSQDDSTPIYALAYALDGSLYAASYGGTLRMIGADFRLKASKTVGKNPYSLALSPDGTRLAVGYTGEIRVDLFEAKSLTRLKPADTAGVDSRNLSQVVWTRDGSLHAAGTFSTLFDGAYKTILRSWNSDGRRQGADRPVGNDAVMDLRPCGSGLAFSSGDAAFGLIGPAGEVRPIGVSAAADMRDKIHDSFRISADARQVYFGLEDGARRPVLFDLAEAQLSEANTPPERLIAARTEGLPVTGWESNKGLAYAGTDLKPQPNDEPRSLAIRSDNSGFYLGGVSSLRAYDSKGVGTGEIIELSGGAWGLVLTPDDKILVAASTDGTIRWFRAEDRAELLALFVDARDRRWVAWTPSGYYMASAGAENLIGWHINRGWGQEAEFYPASQFHDRYYRPDIVQLVLKTLDETVAVEKANAARAVQLVSTGPDSTQRPSEPRDGALPPLIAVLPPQVTIVSPADGTNFSDPTVEIAYRVRAAAGQTIDSVQALVDGHVVSSLKANLADHSEGAFTLTLQKQNVVVEVKAASGSLVGQGARVKLDFGGPPQQQPTKPDLYVLAIGVDDYENSREFPKTYAGADVTDLTAALKKQENGMMFANVLVESLVGVEANVERLRRAFDNLTRRARDNDYVIIYAAGHGYVGADSKYRFMLRSADLGRLNSTSLTARDLLEPLSTVRGRKLMLVESCHAGMAMPSAGQRSSYSMDDALNNLRREAPSDLIIFGASEGFELARFDASWNDHGAFTQALIEAIGEAKAAAKNGEITVLSLFHYLQDRIPGMTKETQHPTITPPLKDISDFKLAVAQK